MAELFRIEQIPPLQQPAASTMIAMAEASLDMVCSFPLTAGATWLRHLSYVAMRRRRRVRR
jgi:hypothetical protein